MPSPPERSGERGPQGTLRQEIRDLGCAVRDDILGVVFSSGRLWCRPCQHQRPTSIARPRYSKRLGDQTGHQSASRQKHLFPTTAATLPHAPMSAEGTEGAFPSRPALIRLKDHHTASKRKAPTNPMARAHEAQTKTATQLESWMAVRCLKCL